MFFFAVNNCPNFVEENLKYWEKKTIYVYKKKNKKWHTPLIFSIELSLQKPHRHQKKVQEVTLTISFGGPLRFFSHLLSCGNSNFQRLTSTLNHIIFSITSLSCVSLGISAIKFVSLYRDLDVLQSRERIRFLRFFEKNKKSPCWRIEFDISKFFLKDSLIKIWFLNLYWFSQIKFPYK